MFKIVYAHVCNKDDKYNRMLHISFASVRLHMPEIQVTVLVDHETIEFMKLSNDCIFHDKNAEIIEVECPEKYNQTEKSRYIKTSIRERIEGDFMFIDSDTVICEDFSQYEIPCSVGMVADTHIYMNEQNTLVSKSSKYRYKNADIVFNSGFLMVKDDEQARKFFREWHEIWKNTETHINCLDQPPLFEANKKLQTVTEVDGTWNCMVSFFPACLQYLANAKIIHYFTVDMYSPYLLTEMNNLFRNIEDPFMQEIINDPKTAFKRSVIDNSILALSGKPFGNFLSELLFINEFIKYIKNIQKAKRNVRR